MEAFGVNGTERLINHHAQAARKKLGSEKQQQRSPSRPVAVGQGLQTFLALGSSSPLPKLRPLRSLPSSPVSYQPLPRHCDATNKSNKGICTYTENMLQPVPRVFLKYVNSRLVSVTVRIPGENEMRCCHAATGLVRAFTMLPEWTRA